MTEDLISQKELVYLKTVQRHISEPLVLFDVGGNRGHYTAHALEYFDDIEQVYVFEPIPRFVDLLKVQFSATPEVEIIPHACSDEQSEFSGFFEIVSPDNHSAEGMSGFNYRPVYELFDCHMINVSTIRLDDFVAERNISRIHFMKVDTEGHEAHVFRGCQKALREGIIDFVQFEYGDCIRERGSDLCDLLSLVEKHGYGVFDHCEGHYVQIDQHNVHQFTKRSWDNFLLSRHGL